ncbi:hypothetical protein OTU49_004862 [Cherax quadricarinatus]|uniref:Uncharacterized protein n=1 Tax=Cherax quadricarinatus TaxID=27406 RepID=A0AAW0WVM5_CHEQU
MADDKAREMMVQRGLGAILANMGAGKIGIGKPVEKKPPPTPPKVNSASKSKPEGNQEFTQNSSEGWGDHKEGSRPNSEGAAKNTNNQRKDIEKREENENLGAIHRGVGAILANMSNRNLGGSRPGGEMNQGGNRPGGEMNQGGSRSANEMNQPNNRPGSEMNQGNNRPGSEMNKGGNRPGGEMNLGGARSVSEMNPSLNKGNVPQRLPQRNQGFNMNCPREYGGWDVDCGPGANNDPSNTRPTNNQRMGNFNKGDFNSCRGHLRKTFGFQEKSLLGEYPGPGSSGPRTSFNPDSVNTRPTQEGSVDRGGEKESVGEEESWLR